MAKDYYAMLGLSKNASENEIREALQRFSDEKNEEVAEAYESLRRTNGQDTSGRSGEQSFKDNTRDGGLHVSDDQRFANTSQGCYEAAFEEFFNPYGGMFGSWDFGSKLCDQPTAQKGTKGDDSANAERGPFARKSSAGDLFGSQRTTAYSGTTGVDREIPGNKTFELYVTLNEVYNGCTKKMKVSRKVVGPGDRVPRVEEKVLTIEVKPGWKAGTRITFRGEGDQVRSGSGPGDLVFVIRDKPHPHFRRDGVDVRYTAKITFKEALRGGKVEVPTLTHGEITVPLNDIVTPSTVKRIPGQGLPFVRDPTVRGDLLLSFDIECPRYTTEDERQRLWDALMPFI